MHWFLFELGIEELPDGVILPALEYLQASLQKLLSEAEIGFAGLQAFSTPRRLALLVKGLANRQEDQIIEKSGPARNIAYTPEGELSPAGLGFLKKCGARPEDAYIETTAKGEFLAVKYTLKGKQTKELLQGWIPEAIKAIPLPKKMIWQSRQLAFSRPIRWIVALWDSELIPVDFYGIASGRESYGNRYLGLDLQLSIPKAEDYLAVLKEGKVIADHIQRREMIQSQMDRLFAASEYRIKEDIRLLDTVNNLVEYPWAVVGTFARRFLELPEKVITSTISQNQKYFSVYDADGRLSNQFVFISNGNPEHQALIRAGNEKVVQARLEDALWFYQEDLKKPLESYVPLLKDVVFQADLGTLLAKTQRVIKLSEYIAQALKLSAVEIEQVKRTAYLSKADLCTLMLGEKEFTRLQGYMGKEYALAAGETPEIAAGIYEHYMPRGGNDSLPESLCGAICAVADKTDTVAGIIGIGQMPTGSQDPFALRRAASGVVQILADRGWDISLSGLLAEAIRILSMEIKLKEDAAEKIAKFFDLRVNWLLKELGISYDVAASVMHAEYKSIDDLLAKARALMALKKEEDFIRLVIGFKRVANIISGAKSFEPLNTALFGETAETKLYEALGGLHQDLNLALALLDYPAALKKLVAFGAVIDEFFDKVLVNTEDKAQKANRYALLAEVRSEFFRVADLSLIVYENESIGE